VKEVFAALDVVGREVGFKRNKYETKMLIKSRRRDLQNSINVGYYQTDMVHQFIYTWPSDSQAEMRCQKKKIWGQI
jgi:hypothetical protein